MINRRVKDGKYRPAEIPEEFWKKLGEAEKKVYREFLPDPRKQTITTTGVTSKMLGSEAISSGGSAASSGSTHRSEHKAEFPQEVQDTGGSTQYMDTLGLAESPQNFADGGIAEGDWMNSGYVPTGEEECLDKDGFPVTPKEKMNNHWMETDLFWVYWKMKPGKGIMDPRNIRTKYGPVMADLSGVRESVPTFVGQDQEDGKVIDRFDEDAGMSGEAKDLQTKCKKNDGLDQHISERS